MWMAVLLAGCAAPSPAPSTLTVPRSLQEAVVIDVDDGDSLTVEIGGTVERVRLLGINAPELDECWGTEARAALAPTDGRTVGLEFDVPERDQFGRLLAHVWLDGTLVNLELVANGSAFVNLIPPDTAHGPDLRAAQDMARTSGVGVWAPCGDEAPAGVVIAGIDANPPGPDEDHLDEESITIANVGSAPVSLGGFVVRDASTVHRYVLPASLTLDPGAEVRIVTGCGRDTETTLHWCAAGPVWNNDGDTALVLTEAGTVAAYFTYGP